MRRSLVAVSSWASLGALANSWQRRSTGNADRSNSDSDVAAPVQSNGPAIPQQPACATPAAAAPQQPEVVPLRPAPSPPTSSPPSVAPATDLPLSPPTATTGSSSAAIAAAASSQFPLRPGQSITRHLKLDAVLGATTSSDFIVAKHEVASIYSYAGYINFSAAEVATRLLASPAPQRTFHSLIGRQSIPCDFYADVDMDLGERNPEAKLIEALHAVHEQLTERGFKSLETLVLTGNSSDKHSFHVHIHSPKMAFGDYREVSEVAQIVNDALNAPIFDLGVYRANATLRLALSAKLGQADRVLTPYHAVAKDDALRSLLASCSGLSSPDLVIRSLVLRPELAKRSQEQAQLDATATAAAAKEVDESVTETRKAKGGKRKGASGSAAAVEPASKEAVEETDGVRIFNARRFRRTHGGDAGSAFTRAMPDGAVRAMRNGRRVSLVPDESGANLVPAFLAPSMKWKRYQEVRKKLLSMPDNYARDYDTWANVGLALHSFASRGEREPLEDFISFSAMCPFKFDRKIVEKKWKGFGVKATERTTRREEDVFTWRRGYNYLNKTIWRGAKA